MTPIIRNPRKRQLLEKIPGKWGTPFVGDLFRFMNTPIELYEEKYAKYGDIFKLQFLGKPMVVIMGEEANKLLLVEQGKNLSSQLAWEEALVDLFPNGLMLMDGDRHTYHRSILRTAFKKDPMQAYLQIMMPIIEEFSQTLKGQKEIQFFPAIKALTLKIAGKVFFGLNFSDDLEYVNKAIIEVVKASTALPIKLPFTAYGKGIKARKVLEKYFSSLIGEKRKSNDHDLFSFLCRTENEDGDKLTDQEIIDHLIFILMAAHDTTASTLTSMCYLLAKHPEWQEKLREECRIFLEHGEIDMARLRELENISLVIKETLRMYPPLILIPRQTRTELVYKNVTIPENIGVTLILYHNHYKDNIWDAPETFDPTRFSKERKEDKKCPHAYAPFGAGVHYCLGFSFAEMQIKLIMLHLLTSYKWTVADDYEAEYAAIPIQEPKDGLPIQLEELTTSEEIKVQK